jgi:hypothetical protein
MRIAFFILYYVICVIIGAVADGVRDEGMLFLAHALAGVEIGLLLMSAFILNLRMRDWWIVLLSYVFYRVAFFDYAYNIIRGLDLFYIGDTSWWDLILKKQYPGGLLFGRAVLLLVGVSLPIKYLEVHFKDSFML